MDTALPQKFPFILDRNLAKANCTENHVCTSCDTVVLALCINTKISNEDVKVTKLRDKALRNVLIVTRFVTKQNYCKNMSSNVDFG